MDYEEFKKAVKREGFELESWAEKMGLSYRGITNWRASEVPVWVDEYFKRVDELRKVEKVRMLIKEISREID